MWRVVFFSEVLTIEAGSHLLIPSNICILCMCFKFHCKDAVPMCWRELSGVRETCCLLLPTISFVQEKTKWKRLRFWMFSHPLVYFLAWLRMKAPNSIPHKEILWPWSQTFEIQGFSLVLIRKALSCQFNKLRSVFRNLVSRQNRGTMRRIGVINSISLFLHGIGVFGCHFQHLCWQD